MLRFRRPRVKGVPGATAATPTLAHWPPVTKIRAPHLTARPDLW